NVVGEALGGDIGLGVINGVDVALSASNSILDANSVLLNVLATNLTLVATNGLVGGDDSGNGSSGTNVNAIEIAVSTLAASSDAGIYLSEADGLTITTVAAVTVDIESVVRVNFNSTTNDVSEDREIASLEDLTTDAAGPIELVSVAGSLTIEGGADGAGVSVGGSGNVLLNARGETGHVFINADVVSGSGTLTQNCYLDPDLKAELDPLDQQLTNENPNAKFNVYVAPGSTFGVGIGWKGLATEQAYVLNGVGGGSTTTAVELPFNTTLKLIENTAVIAVSLNAFAPSSEGVGTIQIFENGENVLAQDRFHTMVSVKVSANMTGGVVMMPTTADLVSRTVPAPTITATPIIIQQNENITTREYGQSSSSTPRAEKPFFFLKFEGLVPQESDKDLSLDYQLKNLSATAKDSDTDFDVDQLPILFGRLPDNYYELFLKDGASEQLIMRFIIQDGNPVNVPPEFSRIELGNNLDNQERIKQDTTGGEQEGNASEKQNRKRNKEVHDNIELSSPDPAELPAEPQPSDKPASVDGTKEPPPVSFIEELGRTPAIALAGTLLTGNRYICSQNQKNTDYSNVTK
ncbi:MAG: hypothetical protein CMM07_22715, partial [Rhodopirellula sp.]|nr:hypothetical protein [Rhodopirellula sp.]